MIMMMITVPSLLTQLFVFFGHFQNFLIAVAMSEQFFRSTVLFSEHTIEF